MADFTYTPNSQYEVSSRYNTLTSTFENQAEQSRLKSSHKLRTWRLGFSNRTSVEMNAVIAFFDTYKEDLTSFTISIDEEEVTGKFKKETFIYRRSSHLAYDYEFEFREVV